MNKLLEFNKNENKKIGKHFKTREFDCLCDACDITKIDFNLIKKLDELRDLANLPVIIISGYRCAYKQNELTKLGFKTAKGISQHQLGRAVDIQIMGNKLLSGKEIEALARQVGFMAVGVADTWAHIDLRDDKIRRWEY